MLVFVIFYHAFVCTVIIQSSCSMRCRSDSSMLY